MKKNQAECCDIFAIHDDAVREVKELLPPPETLEKLTVLFKTIADSTRLKILWTLSRKELCVCDISFLMQMSQSAISHQLKVLKDSDLVRSRKSGKIVYYSLKDDHVRDLYTIGMNHISERD